MKALGSAKSGERPGTTDAFPFHRAGLERDLEGLVRFAAELLHAPGALMSLVSTEGHAIVAQHGTFLDDAPRHLSFCDHVLECTDLLVVPDVASDARFAVSRAFAGQATNRFYAGAPLVSRSGEHRLGALCVLDHAPRAAPAERELRLLSSLAALAVDRMELRRVEAGRGTGVTRFERMAGAIPAAVVCADDDGRVTHWNPAAERMFGWTAAEMLGGALERIVPERLRARHREGFAARVARGCEEFGGRTLDLAAVRRDGSEFPATITLACWREDDGRMAFGAYIRDVTLQRRTEERLLHLAHHDPLTGLPNRAKLAEALQDAARGPAERAGLILLDLDGFKHVNDVLGHDAADLLLREAADRMAGCLDGDALLARLGADEFAVLLPSDAEAADGALLAARLQQALAAEPFHVRGSAFRVAASAGLAVLPAAEARSLLANADLALHRAKAGGGGARRTYQPAMRAEHEAGRLLGEEVRRAAEHGEFMLLYQPQVSLRDGSVVGAEALLRWQHPARGLLAPDAFLAALEPLAQAGRVGDWIIDEACRQAAAWRALGARLRVGVNLFAEQLRRGNLHAVVEAALERHALPPAALELEVTERIVLRKTDAALEPLRRLRALGVGIAFDDFGTGHASLVTLKRFPLTRLKIDRAFVSDLATDLHDAAIVDSILALAHRLGLEVTAEGVEDAGQEAYLVAQGCGEGQGFLYGRPMAGNELLRVPAARPPRAPGDAPGGRGGHRGG